jgi:hypothetical protein
MDGRDQVMNFAVSGSTVDLMCGAGAGDIELFGMSRGAFFQPFGMS